MRVIILHNFWKKIKLPVSIALIAMLITGVAGAAVAIYEGRQINSSAVDEVVAVFDENEELSVAEAIEGTDVLLPEEVYNEKVLKIKTSTCKKYIEYEAALENGTVTIRKYGYTNTLEDEMVTVPKNAERISWKNTDVFIFGRNNSTYAVYYIDTSICTIIIDCSADEMKNIFT